MAEAWGSIFSGRRTLNISPARMALQTVNSIYPTTVKINMCVTEWFKPWKSAWQLEGRVLYLFLLEFYQHYWDRWGLKPVGCFCFLVVLICYTPYAIPFWYEMNNTASNFLIWFCEHNLTRRCFKNKILTIMLCIRTAQLHNTFPDPGWQTGPDPFLQPFSYDEERCERQRFLKKNWDLIELQSSPSRERQSSVLIAIFGGHLSLKLFFWDSCFVLHCSLSVKKDVSLGFAHLLHATYIQFGVIAVDPKTWESKWERGHE